MSLMNVDAKILNKILANNNTLKGKDLVGFILWIQ